MAIAQKKAFASKTYKRIFSNPRLTTENSDHTQLGGGEAAAAKIQQPSILLLLQREIQKNQRIAFINF
jgi:hypothetical protein